jgi:hypothetical protein
MKTGNTYWEREIVGEKERQIENRLERERERGSIGGEGKCRWLILTVG